MLTKKDLENIRSLVEVVVEEALEERLEISVSTALDRKLGEDYMERIGRIEDNTDAAVKISSDTQQELVVTQAKVDRHEEEIENLQSIISPAAA